MCFCPRKWWVSGVVGLAGLSDSLAGGGSVRAGLDLVGQGDGSELGLDGVDLAGELGGVE